MTTPKITTGAGTLLPLLFSVAAALVTGSPSAGQGAPPSDPRLDARIIKTQPQGSLEEYAERMAEASGASHGVAEGYRARPLLVLGPPRTTREAQRALADLFALTWVREASTPPGYELRETGKDRQRRSDERARMERKSKAALLQRWELVRRYAFGSEADLREFEKREPRMARSLRHPSSGGFARLVYSLPGGMIQKLWNEGDASMRIGDLPQSLRDLATAAGPQGKRGIVTDDGQEIDIPFPPIEDATLRLRFGGTPDRPTILGIVKRDTDGRITNLLYPEGFNRQSPEERREIARKSPSKAPADPRFTRRVTLLDPASRSGVMVGERPPTAKPLAPFLHDLARQTGLPIYAEAEFVPREKDPEGKWLARQWWLADDIHQRPLAEALDLLCADFEYEWRFENGALLLRPRLWFLSPDKRGYVFPKLL